MTVPDEERVQRRPHQIWEREGRPIGQQIQHWEQAKSEIEAEDAITTGTEQQTGEGGLSGDLQAGGTNPGSGLGAGKGGVGTGGSTAGKSSGGRRK